MSPSSRLPIALYGAPLLMIGPNTMLANFLGKGREGRYGSDCITLNDTADCPRCFLLEDAEFSGWTELALFQTSSAENGYWRKAVFPFHDRFINAVWPISLAGFRIFGLLRLLPCHIPTLLPASPEWQTSCSKHCKMSSVKFCSYKIAMGIAAMLTDSESCFILDGRHQFSSERLRWYPGFSSEAAAQMDMGWVQRKI